MIHLKRKFNNFDEDNPISMRDFHTILNLKGPDDRVVRRKAAEILIDRKGVKDELQKMILMSSMMMAEYNAVECVLNDCVYDGCYCNRCGCPK